VTINSHSIFSMEDFGLWIDSIDDHIADFIIELPKAIAIKLTYTPKALNIVETWLNQEYPNKEVAMQAVPSILEGASCYIGETFRRNLGGYWGVHLVEPNFPFGKVPVIERFDDMATVLCPWDLMLLSLDKRVGTYLHDVLSSWKAQK
jgi:hypothetical protein